MKKLILHILFVIPFLAGAQTTTTSHETGITGGGSYYLGELNHRHFVPFSFGGGLFYRYNYDDRLALTTAFHYLPIKGDDGSTNGGLQNIRNQSFSSTIYELSIVGELNFLKYTHLEKSSPYTPYVFLGFGYFYHDLKTQAEGVNYKSYQASIPLGLGIKYRVGKVSFEFEWGIRKTYTDYLDDVSGFFQSEAITSKDGSTNDYTNFQRGNVFNKDWFVYTGLALVINLTPKQICRRP